MDDNMRLDCSTRVEGKRQPVVDTTALPPIFRQVLNQAQATPGRVATIFRDQPRTYAELATSIDSVAKALIGAGVGKGDRVSSLSTPRPEFVVTYLAASSIGAVWQGLNPKYTTRELVHVLSDAAPRLVFALSQSEGPGLLHRLHQVYVETTGVERPMFVQLDDGAPRPGHETDVAVNWNDFLQLGSDVSGTALAERRAEVIPADPAILVYTSGTTGAPKGALVRHSGLSRLGHIQSSKWRVAEPRILVNQPINHIGCVGDLCSVTLYAGGSLVFMDVFDTTETLKVIARHEVSALFQIPTQLQMIATDPLFEQSSLDSLKVIGWGGGALAPSIIDKYRAKGCWVTTTYGLTEVTSSVSYADPDADDETLTTTVGKPDPELQVRFLDVDSNQWAGPNGPGEVCVKHPTVMAGYLHLPEKTAEAFTADGWLRTGDIGELKPDGNLRLMSRTSEMYKSGGYNIYPREIEQVLEEFPGIHVAVVVSRPDDVWSEVGAAYLEAEPTVQLEAVKAHARANLANYKVPKSFTVASLPRLSNDKVDKRRLRAHARGEAELVSAD